MSPMPQFAPYESPQLLCADCGNLMRRVISRHKNGKISGIVYFCDNCKYGHASSMPHHNGQYVKYEPPAPASLPNPKVGG